MRTAPLTHRVLLPLALATAMTLACTAPSPPVRLGVGYVADGAYADPAFLQAEVTQGGWRQVIGPSQLTIRSRTSTHIQANAEGIRLQAGEPVTVRVAIVLGQGGTAAAGSSTWTPERDWRYGVTAVVGTQRPVGFCMLSVTPAGRLPPRGGTEGDTLFIVRSGLPQGAVC